MLELIVLIIKIIVLVILVILLLVVAFCIVPIKYDLRCKIKDKVLSIVFRYFLFTFDFYIDFKDIESLKYKAYIFNKVIADSSNKEKKEGKKDHKTESIKESGFIQNKDIEKEINKDDKIFASLVKRSQEYDKKIEEARTIKEKEELEKEMIKGNISTLLDNLNDKLPRDMIDATKLISDEAVKCLKHIMPKDFILNLTFGLDDPYIVGNVLSYMSVIYAKYGDSISVTPYFDRDILYGELHIIGYPQLIHMLIPIARLFLNKRFREILYDFKERKKQSKVKK